MIYNVYKLINEVNKRRKGKRGGIMEGWRGRRQEWEPPAAASSPTCPFLRPRLSNVMHEYYYYNK